MTQTGDGAEARNSAESSLTAAGALRTPDDQFEGLTGFSYEPSYVEDLAGYEGLRAHYLDLGPRNAQHTFLCLHGEPDWAYIYRKMIPVFLDAGARVVAPDFYGFGRSDKPARFRTTAFIFTGISCCAWLSVSTSATLRSWSGTGAV